MKHQWYQSGDALLEEIGGTKLPDSMAALWYIGQMGTVVKWRDKVIYIDPVLNDLYSQDGITRRNYEPPFQPEQVRNIDYVLCSHGHADHINLATLLPLYQSNPQLKFLVPVPERQKLLDGGISETSVMGVNAGDVIELEEDIKINPIAAAHEEYTMDENGCYECLGYVLELGGIHLYHAGDTLVTQRLIEDVKRHTPIHIACLPINGVDAERHQRGIIGNMDGRDAVYLTQSIGSDLTIPMHFDMVMGNEENPLIFGYYMQKQAPGRKYHVMSLGERYLYMV